MEDENAKTKLKESENEPKKDEDSEEENDDDSDEEDDLEPSAQDLIAEMWREEDSLTLENRRNRYHKSRYVEWQTISRWQEYFVANSSDFPPSSSHCIRAEAPKISAELNNKIALWRGDMSALEIDAVQNAANRSLLGGGGIDGVLHSGAGRKMVEETRLLNGCDTGFTKISRGYDLPAKFVLHTVGPIGENPSALRSCYMTTLDLATQHDIRSVALCGVSTGIYGYPRKAASHVAISTVREWLETDGNKDKVDLIVFVVYLSEEKDVYESVLPVYFPVEEEKVEVEVEKEEDGDSNGHNEGNEASGVHQEQEHEQV